MKKGSHMKLTNFTNMSDYFEFEFTILSDLRILNPSERCNFSDLPGAAVRLAKELPQLKLTKKLDELKVEAIDYQLADSEDLPSSIDATNQFWSDMHGICKKNWHLNF